MKLLATLSFALTCAAFSLRAETLEISNARLRVRYDEGSAIFTAAERESGRVFLKEGRLEGECLKAAVKGHRLVVSQADGSAVTLELRGDAPFVFITKELRNAGTSATDLQRVAPVSFSLDLGKPADELRTMGTAGLTAPDKHPGSYPIPKFDQAKIILVVCKKGCFIKNIFECLF